MVSRKLVDFPDKENDNHDAHLRRSNFGASSEQLLAPLAANSLKPANNIPTLLTSFTVSKSAVPVTALNPPRAFLAAFFFVPQIGDEFPGRAEAP